MRENAIPDIQSTFPYLSSGSKMSNHGNETSMSKNEKYSTYGK